MWGIIIFCLVFLVAGILIAVFPRWLVEFNFYIDRGIDRGLEKYKDQTYLISNESHIRSAYHEKSKRFILWVRILGIVIALVAVLVLYLQINSPK